MAILLYLDTNVLCRPFDDQTPRRIRSETEAFEHILDKVEDNEAAFVTSEILVFEIQRIISPTKRAKASAYLHWGKVCHITNDETLALAEEIIKQFKLAPRDALHTASALLEKAQYFLSCDDGLTKRFKKKRLSVSVKHEQATMEVMNPADFVEAMKW